MLDRPGGDEQMWSLTADAPVAHRCSGLLFYSTAAAAEANVMDASQITISTFGKIFVQMESVAEAALLRLIPGADVLEMEPARASAVAAIIKGSAARDESKDEPRWRPVGDIMAAPLHSRQNNRSRPQAAGCASLLLMLMPRHHLQLNVAPLPRWSEHIAYLQMRFSDPAGSDL